MTQEQIRKASMYKLANRLYELSTLKPNKRVEVEYNLIVEEMQGRIPELIDNKKGIKRMKRSKKKEWKK